ncbi:MAG: hypothetical protein O3B01_13225 [Planctomycetota bacterium]|nr:hypothetical protein [Planctomycetota bacterium]
MPNYKTIEGVLPQDREGSDWGVDPESKAKVFRLTSSPAMSHNIYCEQPYTSPDGRKALIYRAFDPFALRRQLIVADIHALRLTLIEPDVPSEMVAHTSWGEWAYYIMHDGSLRRVSLMTLERQEVLPPGSLRPPPAAVAISITSDNQWLIADEPAEDSSFQTVAISTIDGKRRVLLEGPENLNPHAQAELCDRNRILYQLIRSGARAEVPVFVRDFETLEDEQVPIGGSWSAESTGHMAWVATTGKIACAVNWIRETKEHDPRHPEGNLVIASPGDDKPVVFPAPNHGFYHVSISKCGRYFVCDDFMDFEARGLASRNSGPVRIVIGNLESRKCRPLLQDCQAYGIAGSSRFEPDPYFTADNRYVIYNASPFGTMQVFAAEVPEEFMRRLD